MTTLEINQTKIVSIAEIKASGTPDESKVNAIIEQFNLTGEFPTVQVNIDNHLISGIEALEAAKQIGQDCLVVEVMNSRGSGRKVKDISIKLLNKHPLNSEIYGSKEDITTLANALQESREIDPLTVHLEADGTYTILRGHRRAEAAETLWLETLPCIVLEGLDENQKLKILLTGNVQREKTIESKVREGFLWEQIIKDEAKQRMGRKGSGAGPVRDIIAKQVGLGSGVNYERAAAAVKAMEEGHPQAEKIRQIVTSPKGKVLQAYKLIEPPKEPKAFTSVEQELNHKQKSIGLGKNNGSQILPASARNEGDPSEMVDFKPSPSRKLTDEAIALLTQLNPEELSFVIGECAKKAGPSEGLFMTLNVASDKYIQKVFLRKINEAA